MEPQTTVCRLTEDGIEVMSASQWVDFTQVAVANCLKVPNNKVVMVLRRLGGGYGAKGTRSAQVACACALACKLTNRPVRFVLTMEANTETVGKRLGLINEYDIDVDDDGKIVKMVNAFSQDFGSSLNENVMFGTLGHMKNCYATDTWTVSSNMVETNAPSHTYCRAPGSTEGVAMIENIMEHIARVTGKDPLAVRFANIPEEHKMKEILSDFIKDTGKFLFRFKLSPNVTLKYIPQIFTLVRPKSMNLILKIAGANEALPLFRWIIISHSSGAIQYLLPFIMMMERLLLHMAALKWVKVSIQRLLKSLLMFCRFR